MTAFRGECCALKWQNVNFKTGEIRIAGNLCYTAAKGVYLDTPKSGRIRVVYASDDTMALLRQLRIEQAKKAVSAFVFTKEGSPEPMHPQSPTRYLKKLSERSGIPDLHPHKLRHTFASIAITNGADVASVSEVLGHSDKAVTLRMYTHAGIGDDADGDSAFFRIGEGARHVEEIEVVDAEVDGALGGVDEFAESFADMRRRSEIEFDRS